jgi:hypothetical protein
MRLKVQLRLLARMGVTRPRIEAPPGILVASVLRQVLAPTEYRKWVLVAVSEMQAEYFEELVAGHVWRARWVALRGHLVLVLSVLYSICPRLRRVT